MSAALRLVYSADETPQGGVPSEPRYGEPPGGGGPSLIDCEDCGSEEWTLRSDGTVGCAKCGAEHSHAEIMEYIGGSE